MATIEQTLQIKGIGKRKMAAVAERAKQLGMTPQRYLRHLIEEDLALDCKARTTTLTKLLGPGTEVDEAELDEFVDAARDRHYRRTAGRK